MISRHLVGLAMLAVSCTPSSRNPTHGGAQPEPRNSSAPQALTLTQTSVLPGTTSVDPSTPRIPFYSANIDQRDTIVPLLTRDASFLSDEGESFGASVELRSVKMPPNGILVTVAPSAPVKPDHWYTLIVNQNSDLQIANGKSPEALSARSNSVWKSDFFTGSAPHVIRALLPLGAKDGSYVHVVFSEPVRLSSLDVGRFISVDGRAVGKCILQSGACASSLGDAMAEEVDVAPIGPLGTFTSLSFAVAGGVPGSGRTVSEGIALSTKRVTAVMGPNGFARVDLGTRDLSPCENGAASCWHAHN